MKSRYGLKQSEVASNLDYLIQVGWVKLEVKSRSFVTAGGMVLHREQAKYKISELGINHLETATMFKKPQAARQVNITNVQGVTVVGAGNIVNAKFTELSSVLDELDQEGLKVLPVLGKAAEAVSRVGKLVGDLLS